MVSGGNLAPNKSAMKKASLPPSAPLSSAAVNQRAYQLLYAIEDSQFRDLVAFAAWQLCVGCRHPGAAHELLLKEGADLLHDVFEDILVGLRAMPVRLGSSLFSVELEMGQAEIACDKVKHSDQIFAGTVAASFAFGSLEHAVEPLHKSVGQSPFPMSQNALEVGLDHLGDLEHREEYVTHMLLGYPAHPTAPGQKAMAGCLHALH